MGRIQDGPRTARAAALVLWAIAAAEVGQAVMLRRRRAAVAELPALPGLGGSEEAAAPAPAPPLGGGLPKRSQFRAVTAVDVLATDETQLDEVTLAEVADLMERTGAEVVDLVPGDLPTERTLRWLSRVDPALLGEDPFHTPGGAHEALALRPDVARRMAGAPGTAVAGSLDRGALLRLTRTAQRYAPTAHTVRFAPRLRASTWTPADHWRERQELHAASPYGDLAVGMLAAEVAALTVVTAGPLLNPVAGLAALLAWTTQPLVALAGQEGPVPPDLVRHSVLRLPRAWVEVLELVRARGGSRPQRPAARPAAPPESVLWEERRTTCPWCGSPSLTGRLDTSDLFQHKPGAFHLDECTDCGHIFQNPRLTPAGLDHYYEDFYDGFGAEQWEQTFAGMTAAYEARIDVMASLTEPQRWLDVGTGYGHFCLAARQRWPKARFEGLDVGDSVLEAERRAWIDQAHHGLFPDLAPALAGTYDVVSMHHYLEHTREPREELAAAATALAPGGHLLIEGPDSASPWTRLGRYWRCWFQPQHQHFITCENLVDELERTGFEVVSVERAAAGEGRDLVVAATLLSGALAGPGPLPWRPEPSRARRLWRPVAMALCVPLQAGGLLVDVVKDSWDKRPASTTPGNAYRVVARRQ